jgi:hypothetical protein
MIIGDMSIDPRRVVAADLEYTRDRWVITVQYLVGDTVTSLTDYYDDYEDAASDLFKLDNASYKMPLTDAISDKVIEDEDGDDSITIGFKE